MRRKQLSIRILMVIAICISLFVGVGAPIKAQGEDETIHLELLQEDADMPYASNQEIPFIFRINANLTGMVENEMYVEFMELENSHHITFTEVPETTYFKSGVVDPNTGSLKLYLKEDVLTEGEVLDTSIPISFAIKEDVSHSRPYYSFRADFVVDHKRIENSAPVEYPILIKDENPSFEIQGGKKRMDAVYVSGGHSTNGFIEEQNAEIVTFLYQPYSNEEIVHKPNMITGKNSIYREITISQSLPQNAVFDESLNPGWTYNQNNNTCSFKVENISDELNEFNDTPVSLKLRFPNAEINKKYHARASFSYTPYDEEQRGKRIDRSITYQFVDSVVQDAFFECQLYGIPSKTVENKQGEEERMIKWRFMIANPDTYDLVVDVCKDFHLDSRLQFVYIKPLSSNDIELSSSTSLLGINSVQEISDLNVYGVRSGRKNVLGTVSSGEVVQIPENIEEVELDSFVISPRTMAYFEVGTKFKNLPSELGECKNSVYYSAHNENGYRSEGTSSDDVQLVSDNRIRYEFDIVLVEPENGHPVHSYKHVGYEPRFERTYTKGDKLYWQIGRVSVGDKLFENLRLDHVFRKNELQFVLLLPPGLDYERTLFKESPYEGYKEDRSLFTEEDISYYENYNNSGQKAIVVTVPEGCTGEKLYYFGGYMGILCFETVENGSCAPGIYYVHGLVRYNGEFVNQSKAGRGKNMPSEHYLFKTPKYVDEYDINQNGNKEEVFSQGQDYYEYKETKGGLAYAEIKSDTNAYWLKDNVLKTKKNARFSYKLSYLNKTETDLESFDLIDILPYEEDRLLLQDCKKVRNSTLRNTLLTKPELQFGNGLNPYEYFDVFYTTSIQNGLTKDQLSKDLTWVKEAPLDQVRGIKVSLKEGKKFPENATLSCILKMQSSSKPQGLAENNFYYQEDQNEYVESNIVKNQNVRFGGDVSIQVVNEEGVGLPDAKLELRDPTTNRTILLTTGNDGYARIPTRTKTSLSLPRDSRTESTREQQDDKHFFLETGTYSFKEINAPVGYGIPSEYTRSKYFQVTGKEELLSIVVVNERKYIDFTTSLIWKDGPSNHPNVKVYLESSTDGKSYKKIKDSDRIVYGTASGTTWKKLPVIDESGKPRHYRAREIQDLDNYTVSYDDTETTTTITHTYTSKTLPVHLKVKWVNRTSLKPAVDFQLLADGRNVYGSKSLVYGKKSLVWEDVPITDKDGKQITYSIKADQVNNCKIQISKAKLNKRKNRIDVQATITVKKESKPSPGITPSPNIPTIAPEKPKLKLAEKSGVDPIELKQAYKTEDKPLLVPCVATKKDVPNTADN